MSKNDTAREVLKKYLNTPNPGYALLVDAPWGAGKTYLVQEILQELANKAASSQMMGSHKGPYLYASLFGTNANRTVDDVIIAETNWNLLEKGIKAVSTVKIGDVGVNLGRPTIANWLIPRLPDIVVLDDLERSTLEVEALYGQINKYVEHGNKNVVLIENTAKNPQKEKVTEWREKLIGRAVKISADVNAALPAILSELPKEPQKTKRKLEELEEDITRIFEETGYQNLRLLRRTVIETYDLLSRLDDEAWKHPDKLSGLGKSYTALAMAFYQGELTLEELKNRHRHGPYTKKAESQLTALEARHHDVEIAGAENPVLPNKVATMLIGKGHMSTDAINAELKQSAHLSSSKETPLWRQAWDWRDLPSTEAESLVSKLRQHLLNLEVTNQGELLHIYSSFHRMAEQGAISEDIETNNSFFIEIIRKLGAAGELPSTHHHMATGRERYGWDSWGDNHVSYGGWGFDITKEMQPVITALKAGMDAAFEEKIPSIADKILGDLINTPETFPQQYLIPSSDFYFPGYPVYSHIDPEKFAYALFNIFEVNRPIAETIGYGLHQRITARPTDLDKDINWIKDMRERLIDHGEALSKISKVQTTQFARKYLLHPKEGEDDKH